MTALRSALMAIVLVPAISVTGAAAAGPATVNSVQSLSPAGGDAHAPHVAIDGKGNALVVWSRSNGFHSRIQLRRRYAAGSLGPVQTLSAPGQDALESQIAIDTKGNAIVVWTRFDGHRNRIQLRRRSASGSLSPVQTLSAQFTDAAQPQVAIDSDGNALVVWTGSEGGGDSRIQLRRRSAAGSLADHQSVDRGQSVAGRRRQTTACR
jgi:hypothetical protein